MRRTNFFIFKGYPETPGRSTQGVSEYPLGTLLPLWRRYLKSLFMKSLRHPLPSFLSSLTSPSIMYNVKFNNIYLQGPPEPPGSLGGMEYLRYPLPSSTTSSSSYPLQEIPHGYQDLYPNSWRFKARLLNILFFSILEKFLNSIVGFIFSLLL